MAELTKKVDALGFDKYQIANIRRAFAANKPTYTKMDALASKIRALGEQYQALENETNAWEGPVAEISKRVLGFELTSREVMAYHNDPALFAEKYPDHPASAAIREMLVTQAPAEEAAPEGEASEEVSADPTLEEQGV